MAQPKPIKKPVPVATNTGEPTSAATPPVEETNTTETPSTATPETPAATATEVAKVATETNTAKPTPTSDEDGLPSKDKLSTPPEAANLVGVTTTYDHKCSIGGTSYVFKAGKRVMVPNNVRCILSRANLLRG